MNTAQESLLDIVKVLFKWRKTILLTTIGITILTAIIVLLLPNYYNSSALLYPANLRIASRGALFGKADETLDIFGKSDDLNRIMMVAESDEIVAYLNEKYDLYTRYDIDSTHSKAFHYVKLNFLTHYNVRKNEKDALEISLEDKNPKEAYEMLWSTIGKIDELVRRMTKRNEEIIMEAYRSRIDAKQEIYDRASDSLISTREKYGIVDVENPKRIINGNNYSGRSWIG